MPALVLDDGTVLNENVAVLSCIADMTPAGALAPAHGTTEHSLVLNHLAYITSDVHAAGFGPLFGQFVNDEAKEAQKARGRCRAPPRRDAGKRGESATLRPARALPPSTRAPPVDGRRS